MEKSLPRAERSAESVLTAPRRRHAFVLRRSTLRRFGKLVALTALFAFSLYPLSVAGIGVNYVFVLLPVVVALVQGRLRNPGDMLLLGTALYAFIFFVASLYQYEFASESTRRFASFAIFMTMFSYAFMTIDDEKIVAFKTALVGMSVFLSLASAYRLLSLAATGITIGFEAKDLVGTQRIGFVYLLAFWLVYLDGQQKAFWGVARYPILVVLTAGLLLTFSRSSIVAMLVSFALFALVRHGGWLKRFDLKSVVNAAVTVLGVAVMAALLYRVFPLAFRFFDVRLFGLVANEQLLEGVLGDQSTSEGTRVYIATRILEFVVRNPLTGSGYLGPWVLQDSFGSSHNQYLDVLFRTGPAGFFLYASVLIAVMRHLKQRHEALFWGMTAVLVYGLFHETFKESQGAFIFAFTVGMMAQAWRDRRDARRRAKAGVETRSSGLPAPD
jgi:O-antigen ligase